MDTILFCRNSWLKSINFRIYITACPRKKMYILWRHFFLTSSNGYCFFDHQQRASPLNHWALPGGPSGPLGKAKTVQSNELVEVSGLFCRCLRYCNADVSPFVTNDIFNLQYFRQPVRNVVKVFEWAKIQRLELYFWSIIGSNFLTFLSAFGRLGVK